MNLTSNKIEYVDIPHDLIIEMQRRHYEWNASKYILHYLMTCEDISMERIQTYADCAEAKFVDAELMKEAIITQYPSKNGFEHFIIDFDHDCIKYSQERVTIND